MRPHAGLVLTRHVDLRGLTMSVTRGLRVDPRFDQDADLDGSDELDYASGVARVYAKSLGK